MVGRGQCWVYERAALFIDQALFAQHGLVQNLISLVVIGHHRPPRMTRAPRPLPENPGCRGVVSTGKQRLISFHYEEVWAFQWESAAFYLDSHLLFCVSLVLLLETLVSSNCRSFLHGTVLGMLGGESLPGKRYACHARSINGRASTNPTPSREFMRFKALCTSHSGCHEFLYAGSKWFQCPGDGANNLHMSLTYSPETRKISAFFSNKCGAW